MGGSVPPVSDERLFDTGLSLALDAVAVEVVSGLRAVGAPSILLRGPVFVEWLYEPGAFRPYCDVDLLVSSLDFSRAEAVLVDRGFTRVPASRTAYDPPHYDETWIRQPTATVELHRTLSGVLLAAEDVWNILAHATQTMRILGVDVQVLIPPARALVVALHAAHHGPRENWPLEDLARALERLPHQTWAEAAMLAEKLEATPAFATGLRLVPQGEDLAARLQLPTRKSVKLVLHANAGSFLARDMEWFWSTPGVRAKGSLAARKLFPDPAFMRFHSSLARRGRAGLLAAYLWRLRLVGRAGPAFRAWRAARSQARDE